MPENKKVELRKKCALCNHVEYEILYPSTVDFGKHLNTEIFSARRLPDRIHGTIVRCKKCGLVRTLEVIDDALLSKLYINSRFTYKNLTNNLRFSYGQILREAIKYSKDRNSFLEIGCGNGFMLDEALKIGFQKVAGIEPSRDAISRAAKTIQPMIKQDVLRPGIYRKNSFDVIAVFQVFDHIPDPNNFLKICLGLLRRGGVLVLMNHDVESFSASVLGERSPIIDIEHTYLYSQKTISKILKKNGYSVSAIYNPFTIFSLRYFLRLLPLQKKLKLAIEKSKSKIFDINIKMKPGNLCAIASKK